MFNVQFLFTLCGVDTGNNTMISSCLHCAVLIQATLQRMFNVQFLITLHSVEASNIIKSSVQFLLHCSLLIQSSSQSKNTQLLFLWSLFIWSLSHDQQIRVNSPVLALRKICPELGHIRRCSVCKISPELDPIPKCSVCKICPKLDPIPSCST